jgi:hypothetical protein
MSNPALPKAICIICFKPNPIWLNFLSGFEQYDIYLSVDDNSENYTEKYKTEYPSVHIIQFENSECENKGFTNLNTHEFAKKVTAWEKGLFYFADVNKVYDHIWFFEDDIFFYDEETIKNIDTKYPEGDLLTAPIQSSSGASKNWWWWVRVKIEYQQPYYNAMVCGLRVSKELLLHIKEYAAKHTLFFLEALFTTIAIKHHLKCHTPKAMTQIFFRHKWSIYTLSRKNIFHPIKNIEYQKVARRALAKKDPLRSITFHTVDLFTKLYMNTRQAIKTMIGR